MPSQQILDEFQDALDSIDTLTVRQLLDLWDSVDLTRDPLEALTQLTDGVLDITSLFGDISATVTADWYDTLRVEAAPAGRFTATPLAPAPAEQVRTVTRWATEPLRLPDPSPDTALTKLAGATRRLVRQPGRDTLLTATTRDPARPRYARVTRGGCAFCLLLASRGAVYASEVPFKAHDHCRCTAVPVWTPDDVPEATRRIAREYDAVTANASSSAERRHLWRQHVETTQMASDTSP